MTGTMLGRQGSRLALSLTLALLCVGCSKRTEVVVALATNLDIPTQIDAVELVVQGGITTSATNVPIALETGKPLPGSIGIGPSADRGGPLIITVRGLFHRAVVVERRATLHFIEGRTLFLRLTLATACYGQAKQYAYCPADQWCAEGVCRSITIDPRGLPDFDATATDPARAQCGSEYTAFGLGAPASTICPAGQYCQESECYAGMAPPVFDLGVNSAAMDARVVTLLDGGAVDAQPADASTARDDSSVDESLPMVSPDLIVGEDLVVMDHSVPDLAMPDLEVPAMPDLVRPDLAMPDLATPDLARPDLVMPDLAMPDFTLPDLATPDLIVFPPPTVSNLMPAAGPPAGGGMLTVIGTGFVDPARVTINGVDATGVVVVSPTKITCTVPRAKSPGRYPLKVINPDLQSANSIYIYYATTLGFGTSSSFALPAPGHGLVLSDLDGTSGLDLLTVTDATQVYAKLNGGTGVFGNAIQSSAGAGTIIEPLLVADLDGNQHPDVVIVGSGAPYDLRVLLDSGGTGSFKAPVVYKPTTGRPTTVGVGDFDGDGRPDLAVTCIGDGTISVLLQDINTPGAFLAARTFNASLSSGPALAIADYTGDGNVDIVTVAPGPDLVLYAGRGNGSFSAGRSLGISGYFLGPVVDLNKDGKPDLLSYNSGAGTLEVRLGNGDGTFKAPRSTVGGGASQMLVADMNLDGNLDVVMAGRNGTYLDVYLGAGDGSLGAELAFDFMVQTFTLAVGDVDGDGLPDITYLFSKGGSIPSIGILINGST